MRRRDGCGIKCQFAQLRLFRRDYQDGAGRCFRRDGPWLCSLHWEIGLERLPFSDGGFELVGDPGSATIEFVRGHILGTIVCGPEYQAPARIHQEDGSFICGLPGPAQSSVIGRSAACAVRWGVSLGNPKPEVLIDSICENCIRILWLGDHPQHASAREPAG